MHLIGSQAGIPTPDAFFPQSRAELLDYLPTAKFPIMRKGVFGKNLEAVTGKRMYKVKSRQELLSLYDLAEDPARPNLMLQEYIPAARTASGCSMDISMPRAPVFSG